jgi:hypothetical protein
MGVSTRRNEKTDSTTFANMPIFTEKRNIESQG